MPRWLDQARTNVETGSYKRALRSLSEGTWAAHESSLVASSDEAIALAVQIAEATDGRLERRAREVAADLKRHAALLEYSGRIDQISANVPTFALLSASADDPSSRLFDAESFQPVGTRIQRWRFALHPCYLAGYAPVVELGLVPLSEAEQVRIKHLAQEAANEIVLDHAAAVRDVAALRKAMPACLGYAIATDDIRLREVVSSLQRHSGTSVQMPSDLAMSTAVLDAMEAAGPPPEERDLFKLVASAAFYVGVGAALQDVVDRSTNR